MSTNPLKRVREGGLKGLFGRGKSAQRDPGPPLVTGEALQSGLRNHEFAMHYQPMIGLADGLVHGAEALLRWEQAGFEAAPARQFLTRALASGTLKEMSEAALLPACELTRELQQKTGRSLRLAVNVSGQQLVSPEGVYGIVRRALYSSNLPSWCFQVEIDEQVLLARTDELVPTLGTLASLGVALVIDDFWGMERPDEVLGMPGIRGVKIDLWANTGNEASREQLARAASLARELELFVAAKRVESDFEVEFAREIGCDYVQGHAYGRPMSADDYRAYVLQGASAEGRLAG